MNLAHTMMIDAWEGQDAGPDRLWRVAIREPGGQTAVVDTPPAATCQRDDGDGLLRARYARWPSTYSNALHACQPAVRPLLRITRPSRAGATTARPTYGAA
jgi:hypothetical protein